jgi:hypothetical protein
MISINITVKEKKSTKARTKNKTVHHRREEVVVPETSPHPSLFILFLFNVLLFT